MGALDTQSRDDLIEYRREWVSKLRNRQLTMREIVNALPKQGIINPDTDKPFSLPTIKADLDVLRKRWAKEAMQSTDEHLSRQFNELQEIKRQAWLDKNGNLALRALETEMKLLGTLSPMKLQVDITLVQDTMEALRTLGQDPSQVFNEIIARAKQKQDAGE